MVLCPYCRAAIPMRRLVAFVLRGRANAMRCPQCKSVFKVQLLFVTVAWAAAFLVGSLAWVLFTEHWLNGRHQLADKVALFANVLVAFGISLGVAAGAKPRTTDYLRLDRESLSEQELSNWCCECSAENECNTLACWNCRRPRRG